jgi:hypothetical protein
VIQMDSSDKLKRLNQSRNRQTTRHPSARVKLERKVRVLQELVMLSMSRKKTRACSAIQPS